jgi:hypothetical protein
MRHSYSSLLLLAVFLICLTAACSSGPSQMFNLAQKAKAGATEVQADQFATDLWVSAEKAWEEGNASLAAGRTGEADKLFLKAKTDYIRARDSARSKRENLINLINGGLVTIGLRLKSDLVDNPAARNVSPARKKEFDAAVKGIEDSSGKITAMVNGGQILEAKVLADKTMRSIFEIQQEFLKK